MLWLRALTIMAAIAMTAIFAYGTFIKPMAERNREKPSIAFSDTLSEPAIGQAGKWTTLRFGFVILRPECRLADWSTLDIRIKFPETVAIPINQYKPPPIRPRDQTEQAQSIYELSFEVPLGLEETGEALIRIGGERQCYDSLTGSTTYLHEETPEYPILIVGGEGGER